MIRDFVRTTGAWCVGKSPRRLCWCDGTRRNRRADPHVNAERSNRGPFTRTRPTKSTCETHPHTRHWRLKGLAEVSQKAVVAYLFFRSKARLNITTDGGAFFFFDQVESVCTLLSVLWLATLPEDWWKCHAASTHRARHRLARAPVKSSCTMWFSSVFIHAQDTVRR